MYVCMFVCLYVCCSFGSRVCLRSMSTRITKKCMYVQGLVHICMYAWHHVYMYVYVCILLQAQNMEVHYHSWSIVCACTYYVTLFLPLHQGVVVSQSLCGGAVRHPNPHSFGTAQRSVSVIYSCVLCLCASLQEQRSKVHRFNPTYTGHHHFHFHFHVHHGS